MLDEAWRHRVEAALRAVIDEAREGAEFLGHALVLAQEVEQLRVLLRAPEAVRCA